MAKVFIQIELDSSDTQTPELLNTLANAFLNTKAAVEDPAANNLVEEPKEEPKVSVKETKKVVKAEEPVADETPEENYTVDDVRTVMAEAKRSGKDSADLRAILKANGAAVVSDLDPEKYAAVIKAVKAL